MKIYKKAIYTDDKAYNKVLKCWAGGKIQPQTGTEISIINPDHLEIWGVQYAPGYKLIMTVVEAKINEKPDQFKTLKLIPS